MKKKISAIILALVMALCLLPAAAFAADGDVAQVGEQTYATVAAAIEAAKDGGTVKLLKDVAEPITIPAGYPVTLDLNGKVLANSEVPQDKTVTGAKHTITNNGTLTITGDGVVDNVSHARAALYNDGKVTIEKAMITRSAEKGSAPNNNGGNSYYVVYNHAADAVMNVEDGALISGTSAYSSCVRNDGVMNINGGRLEQDDFIVVKNDSGTLNVTGGVISSMNDQAIQNWSKATISGGAFSGDIYTWAYTDKGVAYAGETVIAGADDDENVSVIINGDVTGVNYDGSAAIAKVSIAGNTLVIGNVKSAKYDTSGADRFPENVDAAQVVVAGGVYTKAVNEKYVDSTLKIQGKITDTDGNTYYTFYKDLEEAAEDGILQGEELTVINPDPAKKVVTAKFYYTADQFDYSAQYELGEDEAVTYTFATPAERENYKFAGWKSSVDGKVYQVGTEVSYDKDVTFTGVWTVTVGYDYGYDQKTTEMDVLEGETIKLPEASREGYTFKGWLVSGTNTTLQKDDSYKVLSNVTFTAQWQAKAPITPTNPATGDSGVALWLILLVLAAVATPVVLVSGNRVKGRRIQK